MRQNRLNVTLPVQACSNEVCYQMEMLRNAAEIVCRFCACVTELWKWFRFNELCLYINNEDISSKLL